MNDFKFTYFLQDDNEEQKKQTVLEMLEDIAKVVGHTIEEKLQEEQQLFLEKKIDEACSSCYNQDKLEIELRKEIVRRLTQKFDNLLWHQDQKTLQPKIPIAPPVPNSFTMLNPNFQDTTSTFTIPIAPEIAD